MTIKQSDNICTVGWRNIHGTFTPEQLRMLVNSIPTNHISATFYTYRFDVNSLDGLQRWIDYQGSMDRRTNKVYAYYFDYPEQYHDKVWAIIQIWFPMIENSLA